MKKFISILLVVTFLLSSVVFTVSADESEIKIKIDGATKNFDVMPVMESNRVLVPMRGIFEELGAEILWDGDTQTVTATKGETVVELQIGNKTAKINGEEIKIDVPARLISSRTMVPVRFVSDSMGCTTDWNDFNNTVIIRSPSETERKHELSGKKVIIIGNSHTYRGLTTIQDKLDVLTQEKRDNDKGYFYMLCNKNGEKVSVTDWCFGYHRFGHLFGEPCALDKGCLNEKHEEYLVDRYYDYVVMQPGVDDDSAETIVEDVKYMMEFFKEANPNAKFILLGTPYAQGINTTSKKYPNLINKYKEVEKLGVTIADWGELIRGIIDGDYKVPGTTLKYEKNTFIVPDGYHPNMLTGYIAAMFIYCAATGESAVGLPYEFYNDAKLNSRYDIPDYIKYYYKTAGLDETLADDVFESAEDMKGIQMLVDHILETKPHLQEIK